MSIKIICLILIVVFPVLRAGIGIGKDLSTEKTSEAKTTGVIGSLLSLAIAEVVYYYAGIFELF